MYIDVQYGAKECYSLCSLTHEQLEFIVSALAMYTERTGEITYRGGYIPSKGEIDYFNRLSDTHKDMKTEYNKYFHGVDAQETKRESCLELLDKYIESVNDFILDSTGLACIVLDMSRFPRNVELPDELRNRDIALTRFVSVNMVPNKVIAMLEQYKQNIMNCSEPLVWEK